MDQEQMTVALQRLSTCQPPTRWWPVPNRRRREHRTRGPLPVKHSGQVFTRRGFQPAAALDDGKDRGDRVCKQFRVCGSTFLFVNVNRSSHNLQNPVAPFFQCRTRKPASSEW